MLLYKKINIENFDSMRRELESATTEPVSKKLRFWDAPFAWFKNNSPLLYDFIESRKKIPVRICRFYLTPPIESLRPHIDGLTTNKSPIGLNIPIIGYENTTMDWYDCPEDNIIDGPYGFNKVNASRILNLSKIKKIDSTCINVPTFVRTDVAHGVVNKNFHSRLILSIRFYYNENHGQNFEEVMDIKDL